MKEILITLLAILIVAIVFAIGGLIYWGIGSLVCVVFDINYNWTFLHGITTQLVVFALSGIFNITIKN